MTKDSFEWNEQKDFLNQIKHGVSFTEAQYAFKDPNRVIAKAESHSGQEQRYYCFGKTGESIMTVRFTWRNHVIRIIGAGYWRKGKKLYEQENQIQR